MAKKEPICEGCSPLATYYNRAKYCYTRTAKIDTITIHCWVGQVTAEDGCNYFAGTDRTDGASCNYVVGCDGSIGICVPEPERSGCSSNQENDNRAVTIEVASNTSGDYAVKDAAYNALIELVADICKRNGIKRLVWSTKKEDRVKHKNGCNMTVHRDYRNKDCPGKYLYDKHGEIAEKVNRLLFPAVYIENFNINSVTKSTVNAKLKLMEAYDKYTWSYTLINLLTKVSVNKPISIKSKTPSFKVSGLCGNTPYTLEVSAKNTAGEEVKSPKLVFSTLHDSPKGVSNVTLKNVDFSNLSNITGTISFKSPSSWGATTKDLKKVKGYRAFLAVNGKSEKTSDNIIGASDTEISLEEFLKGVSFEYEDSVQIGIQPWVEDNQGNIILSDDGPVFSKPFYIKSKVTPVNKIYIGQNDTFHKVSVFQTLFDRR